MRSILIASAAFAVMATAAVAQPEGPPPSEYPPCTHRDQDRCKQMSRGHVEHHRHHVEHHPADDHK